MSKQASVTFDAPSSTLRVDMDAIDLDERGGHGSPAVRLDFIRDGKRQTVALSLVRRNNRDRLVMTAIGKSQDTVRHARIRPWVDMAETGEL